PAEVRLYQNDVPAANVPVLQMFQQMFQTSSPAEVGLFQVDVPPANVPSWAVPSC
ncbi:hypothetical protein U1Q18_009010, partial [Sarracenia purpurea var. burkii]